MTQIDKSQLEQKLNDKNTAVINVLDVEFYNNEHIPGSLNAPAEAIDFLEQVEALADKSQAIILYSADPGCPAAPHAARVLTEEGYTQVDVYKGGMQEWKEQGGKLESNIPGAVDDNNAKEIHAS